MKLSQLRNAYPTLPPATQARMLDTARRISIQGETPARRPMKKGLIIHFCLLLALASAAYGATQLGILSYLISNNDPTPELPHSAQAVRASSQADNIAITVTGAMYDGEQLGPAPFPFGNGVCL